MLSERDNIINENSVITSHLVFQCIKCNIIVGDSTSFQTSNEDLQVIILSGASNIQKGTDVFTSKSGIDIGSTYFSFNCKGCKVIILYLLISILT